VDLEGVPGPLTATHLITWGGSAADHPWEETEPEETEEESEEESPCGVGGGGGEAGRGYPEDGLGDEGEAGMASRIVPLAFKIASTPFRQARSAEPV
jgi:hypothetical protein